MQVNEFEKFFIKCAGGDTEILDKDKIPLEYNKQVGIGAAVFLTAIYAGLAMSYTLSWIITDNRVVVIMISLFWALAIFNLDRLIVSTTHKKLNFKFSDLLQFFFRSLLAIIIALTICIPLEIKLFETELKNLIERNKEAETLEDEELIKIEEKKAEYDNLFLQEVNEGLGGRRKTIGKVSAKWESKSRDEEIKYNRLLEKLKKEAKDTPIGFINLYEALEEYKLDPIVYNIASAITLLLILFELTPIIIKLTLTRGSYDERLEVLIKKRRISMQNELERYSSKKTLAQNSIPRTIFEPDDDVSDESTTAPNIIMDYLQGRMVDIMIAIAMGIVLGILHNDNIYVPTIGGLLTYITNSYLIPKSETA